LRKNTECSHINGLEGLCPSAKFYNVEY